MIDFLSLSLIFASYWAAVIIEKSIRRWDISKDLNVPLIFLAVMLLVLAVHIATDSLPTAYEKSIQGQPLSTPPVPGDYSIVSAEEKDGFWYIVTDINDATKLGSSKVSPSVRFYELPAESVQIAQEPSRVPLLVVHGDGKIKLYLPKGTSPSPVGTPVVITN